jgi:hypothetical protein
MDATLNPQSPEQHSDTYREPQEASTEKSELMQIFESQVHDMYWAYKDLLRAILESDNEA